MTAWPMNNALVGVLLCIFVAGSPREGYRSGLTDEVFLNFLKAESQVVTAWPMNNALVGVLNG